MTEMGKITQKIFITKSLAYIDELKDSDMLNSKENQLMILNGYKNTLNQLLKSIEEVELLEEKLTDKQKQVEILLNILESYKNKDK